MTRLANIVRKTTETDIQLELSLDGSGVASADTRVGFLDHMLDLFAAHGLFDLTVKARGDIHVDAHHTVEDVGICLGMTLAESIGDKQGIRRYGSCTLPMDETLVTSAVDLSGRPYCVFRAELPASKVGEFDTELVEEFWIAVANHARCNLHVLLHHGRNTHHICEAIFKSLARSFREAVESDPRRSGVPSTKGQL